MAGRLYRAARQAARRELPLLAAGNLIAEQAAKNLADRLAADTDSHASSTATGHGFRCAPGRRPPPSRSQLPPTTPAP